MPREELAAVRATFGRWLYLPDPGALYAALATVATHRLDGDPAWLLLVGPSGAGKTELLNALGDGDDAGRLLNVAVCHDLPDAIPVQLPDGGDVRSLIQSGGLDELLEANGV